MSLTKATIKLYRKYHQAVGIDDDGYSFDGEVEHEFVLTLIGDVTSNTQYTVNGPFAVVEEQSTDPSGRPLRYADLTHDELVECELALINGYMERFEGKPSQESILRIAQKVGGLSQVFGLAARYDWHTVAAMDDMSSGQLQIFLNMLEEQVAA